MPKHHHPTVMGPYSYKLTGTWVRHLPTGHIGYISFVEHRHDGPALIHIIYPPKPVNPINSISSGSALRGEVKKLRKRKPRRFVHPYLNV